ncbi:hypothetical protein ANO11243_027230 [Dothideomycetidae sp. 11243]|nr:hypothetical protein ANO11243_027230 [fungal sp. No.11243]
MQRTARQVALAELQACRRTVSLYEEPVSSTLPDCPGPLSSLLTTLSIHRTKSRPPNPDLTVLQLMQGCKCVLEKPSSITSVAASSSASTTHKRKKKQHSSSDTAAESSTDINTDSATVDLATTMATTTGIAMTTIVTTTTVPTTATACTQGNSSMVVNYGDANLTYTQVLNSYQHYYFPSQTETLTPIAGPLPGGFASAVSECAAYAANAYLANSLWVEVVNVNASDPSAWTCIILYTPLWNPTLNQWTEQEDFGCAYAWELQELNAPPSTSAAPTCTGLPGTMTGRSTAGGGGGSSSSSSSAGVKTMSFTGALVATRSEVLLSTAVAWTTFNSAASHAVSSCADFAVSAYNGTALDFMLYDTVNMGTQASISSTGYVCVVYSDAGGDLVGEATYNQFMDCAYVYQHQG